MIPVPQLIFGDGKEGRPKGDCFRACVASIFELAPEDVPHFTERESRWFSDFIEWLRPMGLTAEHVRGEPTDRPKSCPAGWWIASVRSENFEGETHAVVMRGYMTPFSGENWTEVAHDPSPKPRRTPYVFVGGIRFAALDPAQIARAARSSQV